MLLAVSKRFKQKYPDKKFPNTRSFCIGEILTPKMEEEISGVFQGGVTNILGTAETHHVGWSCKEKGFHVESDTTILEVLNQQNKRQKTGKTGFLTYTSLINEANPILRYKNYDLAVQREKCRCKTTFDRVGEIRGTLNTLIPVSDNELICPDILLDSLADLKEVLTHHLYVKKDKMTLKILPNHTISEETVKIIKYRLRNLLGLKNVFVEKSEKPAYTPGGKLRTVISDKEVENPLDKLRYHDPTKFFSR